MGGVGRVTGIKRPHHVVVQYPKRNVIQLVPDEPALFGLNERHRLKVGQLTEIYWRYK